MTEKTAKDPKKICFIAELWILGVAIIVFALLSQLLSSRCTEPSYLMDSPCFNATFRCEVECRSHGLNFSHIGTENCFQCWCNETAYVSACSGSLYEVKKP